MTADDALAGFTRTILADPDDAGPRLVLADWFQEHGEDELADSLRGEGHWEVRPGGGPWAVLYWVEAGAMPAEWQVGPAPTRMELG